jgi:hypothetical protein
MGEIELDSLGKVEKLEEAESFEIPKTQTPPSHSPNTIDPKPDLSLNMEYDRPVDQVVNNDPGSSQELNRLPDSLQMTEVSINNNKNESLTQTNGLEKCSAVNLFDLTSSRPVVASSAEIAQAKEIMPRTTITKDEIEEIEKR